MASANSKDLVEDVCQYCFSDGFFEKLLQMLQSYGGKITMDKEHKLEYTSFHQQFSVEFERLLEEFVKSRGYSLDWFYELSNKKMTKLNSNGSNREDDYSDCSESEQLSHLMISMISTVTDYENFIDLVRDSNKRDYFFKILKGYAQMLKKINRSDS